MQLCRSFRSVAEISALLRVPLGVARVLVADMSDEHFSKVIEVNLGSTFGSIGYPGFSAYCASKFALRGFSEALRRELADTRVKVLYFAPRATRTSMNAANVVAMNDELHQAMDEPQEVAQQLLQAIRREDDEHYLGWPEKFFVRLNSLLPRVVDQALRKQLPIIQRFARSKS